MRADRMRDALAHVEAQRDDAIAYLSAIKDVFAVLGSGRGVQASSQEIARVLLHHLGVETCALVLRHGDHDLRLAGYATQGERFGGPRDTLAEASWLALARLVGPGAEPSCFRRAADGGFESIRPSELADEGFVVLPFTMRDEAGGALVLHTLVAPAQTFARGPALALLADIVGQALTVAYERDATEEAAAELHDALGLTRQAYTVQQETLRSREENIQRLTQALIRSNRVKNEFLGTVSHELRTPLNAILGYSSLLREGLVGTITDQQAGVLDRVLGSTQHLNTLIEDMLFFVQVEADHVLVRAEDTGVQALVDEVLTAIPGRPPADKVALRVAIAPAAATLHVDAGLLKRVLFHLVGNAFKFTAAGEVMVDLRAADEPGAAVLIVRDTGVGIPAERLHELFEIFSQGDGSNSRRYEGLGMGLTLVQRAVRLLGGEVTVESWPGAGSEFRVLLPGTLPVATTRRRAPQATGSTLH